MKSFRYLFVFLFLSLSLVSPALAVKGVIATPQDMARLKADLKNGRLNVGITRLSDVINEYGEPLSKTDGDRKVSLEYGDLTIDFDKKRYWREWSYDSFKSPAYSDKIKLLRQKLESDKIVGENIPIEKFYKDYDEATEIYLTPEDGGISLYYYGDIRLTFENVVTLKSWEAKSLVDTAGVQSTVPVTAQGQSISGDSMSSLPAPVAPPAAVTSTQK